MVNTRVKDPLRRKVNRKIGRQKSAMIRQNLRALRDPLDSDATFRAEVHNLKITEHKKLRKSIADGSSKKNGKAASTTFTR